MNDRRRHAAPIALAVTVLLAVVACSGSAGGPAIATPGSGAIGDSSAVPASSAAPSVGSSPGPATPAPATPAPATPAPAVVLAQAWATAPLVDVSTGETFRIADHAGKVIIIETMAIWCSNCRVQQRDVQAALARLPAERVVYVVLDVDPNEDGESLAAYRVQNGFQGRYAIAGNEVARALAADFGDQFLNPPSTPMLVVGTDGTVTQTEFGHKSPDDLVALAVAAGA